MRLFTHCRYLLSHSLRAACVVACASIAISAGAVPAKRMLHEVTQPDGSVISVMLNGDERRHYITTEDGLPLVKDNSGRYVYAVAGPGGRAVPSDIQASPATSRSEAEKVFINTFDRQAAMKAMAATSSRFDSYSRNTNTAAGTRAYPMLSTTFPSTGEQKAIVVLVEFTDRAFITPNPRDYWDEMLNKEGYSVNGHVGSARDYFIQSSNGQFRPSFDVYGPVKLKYNMKHYGANNYYNDDSAPEEMAIEACEALDDIIDFAEYDRDNDGYIDNIYIFYAGFGEADSMQANTVWPHSYDVTLAKPGRKYEFDGVILDHYACSNELQYKKRTPETMQKPDGIGTFVHEFSHVLGLPDLYTTVYNDAHTPGEWSILDYGPYSGDGRVPPLYSSFERYSLSWMEPEEIIYSGNYTLRDISGNKALKASTERKNEFFLFEYRSQEGFDTYLPGSGMLVWHIDFNQSVWDNNEVNNNANHQYVDLVEADNIADDNTLDGDAFPGPDNVTEFGALTTPALVSWSKRSLGILLSDIRETENAVKFRLTKDGAEEKPDDADDPSDAVSEITTDSVPGVTCHGRMLSISTGNANVFTMSGINIGTVSFGQPLQLPEAGIYFVKTGSHALKIIVR